MTISKWNIFQKKIIYIYIYIYIYIGNKGFLVEFFIFPITPLNKFAYKNVILIVLLKNIIIYIIFSLFW